MNKFLNLHWKDVIKELGPVVAEAVSEIFSLLLGNIAQLVPYSEIYPDKPPPTMEHIELIHVN